MSQPLFSILTSAHQNEQYLTEMIDSVRGQTIDGWELIIVGTSDETVRIVAGYGNEERVRLVRHAYQGLGNAVDAAAAVADGQYYAVVHGDDVLKPTFCERTAAVLDKNPGIDAVGVDVLLLQERCERGECRSNERKFLCNCIDGISGDLCCPVQLSRFKVSRYDRNSG